MLPGQSGDCTQLLKLAYLLYVRTYLAVLCTNILPLYYTKFVRVKLSHETCAVK